MRSCWLAWIALALAAASCAGGETHSATVITSASTGPTAGGGNVTVRLDDSRLKGLETHDTVTLGFSLDELKCAKGGAARLDELVAGAAVRFRRRGEGVKLSLPPFIRAERVVVDCKS